MNCHQVRTVIDGRPIPRVARPRPGDVRRHLENCAECRETRQALDALERKLKQLPSPTPRHSIRRAVATRLTEETAELDHVADVGQARPRRSAETLCWALMLAGMVLGGAAGVYQILASAPAGLLPDSVLGILELPGPGVQLALGTGVLLYLSGLIQWIEQDTPRGRAGGTYED